MWFVPLYDSDTPNFLVFFLRKMFGQHKNVMQSKETKNDKNIYYKIYDAGFIY